MNSGKGNMVLLTVIAIATLLVAVVGATFAYFSATMNGSESSTTIEVTSGTLSTEYNGDSKINAAYINPGDVIATKEFTTIGVVTGSTNLNYEATLVVTNNTYAEGELVYTITSYNESNNGSTIASTSQPVAIPTGISTISLGTGVFAGPIPAGSTHKYTVTVSRAVQADDNVDKTFSGHLSVIQSKK